MISLFSFVLSVHAHSLIRSPSTMEPSTTPLHGSTAPIDHQNGSWSPPRARRASPTSPPPAATNGHLHHASRNNNPPQLPRPQSELSIALDTYESQYFPGQPKSLSGIATRSFILGNVLVLSCTLTIYTFLSHPSSPLWRAPLFLSILSLFHFLEFWTTARYNTRSALVSSFLLSQNGSAYNIAHTTALAECLLTNFLFPQRNWLHPLLRNVLLFVGLLAVIGGQTIRSAAMIAAGTNFNHVVQRKKDASHRLVTTGVYAYLRHPSYFGFFWWGLGTQLLLGNAVCFMGYAVVLWRFFSDRIAREEKLLIGFFGNEYVEYRKKTPVGIPFIR